MENNLPKTDILNNVNIDISNNYKNILILFLGVVVVFSLLGINILQIIVNVINSFINIFKPVIIQILSILGFTTGTVLKTTAGVATEATKLGVEIAGGTVQSVGTILQDVSKSGTNMNQSGINWNTPSLDISDSTIQKPITSSKAGWCLSGEYQGRRSCVEVDDIGKCMSGQVFPTQQLCLNPTLSSNM
jgi:hypothetical protein|tara:strand:- start:3554 stop:4120 length:567 start_codon:yes stop_codon:yes gene_type:complete